MSARSRHAASARNRINHTNAWLVSSRKSWQTASIDANWFKASPHANSGTVKATTLEGLVGKGVRCTVPCAAESLDPISRGPDGCFMGEFR
jgi:hypothetical protein